MPIHDWTRVPAGIFHDFHQTWSIHIKSALNAGLLPKGWSALVEQRAGSREGDVIAIEAWNATPEKPEADGGVMTMERPTTTIVRRSSNEAFAERANRIVIRHHLGKIVAVVEIVSPENKDSRSSLRDFVDKAALLMRQGIHLLVIDLFPPTSRDPSGIHQLIWDEVIEEEFVFPAGKDRLLASYEVGPESVAYIEPIAVGDCLPDMPLFLSAGRHVRVPLEKTYLSTWDSTPADMRHAVKTGTLPDPAAFES